jgi:hypothetical protein
MRVYLSREERLRIMEPLTNNQKDFLQTYVRRGMATVYARKLAGYLSDKDQARAVVETFMDNWDFVGHVYVSDDNWRAAGLRCSVCGRSLREQYTIQHKQTGEVLHLGESHFAVHTGLPEFVVKQITKEMGQIDYELDELLMKIRDGWVMPFPIPDGFSWPDDLLDLKNQLDLGLPLLDKQLDRLRTYLRKLESEQRQKSGALIAASLPQSVASSRWVKVTPPSRSGWSELNFSGPSRWSEPSPSAYDEHSRIMKLESLRRQDVRRRENIEAQRAYFRRCKRERLELGRGLVPEERKLMDFLFKKFGYTPESLPGVFGVEVEGSEQTPTPSFLWQLWVYDTFVFDKERTYVFTAHEVVVKAEEEGIPRLASYRWFIDTFDAYLRVLADLFIVHRVGGGYRPTGADLVSLSLKHNVYLKVSLEGHTPDDRAIEDYRQLMAHRG